MVYIICDTNIWLYLANGFDSEKQNFDKSLYTNKHFELLEILKEKVDNKECKFLINDVILKEWNRNKKHTLDLINTFKSKKIEFDSVAKYFNNYISIENLESLSKIVECAKIEIDNKISDNLHHIRNVELFLKESCDLMPISETIISSVSNMALDKEFAPFKTNKNNLADGIILYSSIEYLSDKLVFGQSKALFVSNNYKDFADEKNINKFHQDILNKIGDIDITYERSLYKVVDLSEDFQAEIDWFNDYIYEENKQNHFHCLNPFCNTNEFSFHSGYFSEEILIADLFDEIIAENQLKLFELPEISVNASQKLDKIKFGNCNSCGISHATCPECDLVIIDIESDNNFYCNNCEALFEIKDGGRFSGKIILRKNEFDFLM